MQENRIHVANGSVIHALRDLRIPTSPLLAAEFQLRHVDGPDCVFVGRVARVRHVSRSLARLHQFLIGHGLNALPKIFDRELGFGRWTWAKPSTMCNAKFSLDFTAGSQLLRTALDSKHKLRVKCRSIFSPGGTMLRLAIAVLLAIGPIPLNSRSDGKVLAQNDTTNTPAPGAYKNCPARGDGGDTILNTLKNRSSQVPSPKIIEIGEILALPSSTQVGPSSFRSGWNSHNLDLVAPYEKTGVILQGYLRRVKQEGQEHCNCERADLNDFHMWLIASPTDTPAKSVVVEATPRWRGANPTWDYHVLQHLVAQHAQIRITGWLMFDQEHPSQLHATSRLPIIRGTLWEVHPVTRIEVFSNGVWREL